MGNASFTDITLYFPWFSTFSALRESSDTRHPLLVASLICLFMWVCDDALLSVGLFSFIATSLATASAFSFPTIVTSSGTQQKFIPQVLLSQHSGLQI